MRAIITGGGTGGHIYPAIAIADEIKRQEPDSEILYIGTEIGLEKDIVPGTGYPMEFVSAMWIDRSNPLKILKTGAVTLKGVMQSRKIMKEFRPDVVIGTGGYVCFPVLFAGYSRKVPCYIHEQNAFPGMANRSLERFVKKVFMGFPEASDYFKEPEKHVVTGNPVRDSFFHVDRAEAREKLGIPENTFVVFSFGGSQGAEKINEVMLDLLRDINGREDITLFFGTGSQYYDEILETLEKEDIEVSDNIHIESYINDMPSYLGAADLIIGRSGALSVAEICTCGRASILIPSPNVTGNHQFFNAKSVADKDGAILIEEKDLESEKLIQIIKELAEDPERVQAMGEASSSCVPHNSAQLVYEGMTDGIISAPESNSEEPSEEEPPEEEGEQPEETPMEEPVETEDPVEEVTEEPLEEPWEEAFEEPLEDVLEEPVEEPRTEEEIIRETMEGIPFKEIPREKRRRRKVHHLRNITLVILAVLVVVGFFCSPIFNVKTINVTGNHYYSDKEIINMSGAKTGMNMFTHSQKKEITEALEKDAYFSEVHVSRKGMSTLEISVKEREQVAALIYGNRYIIIDVNGIVLRVTDVEPKLTIIKGLTLSKIKAGKSIKAEESTTLEDTLIMLKTMQDGDLFFKKIEVSKIYLKAYIYDTLAVKGKAEDLKEVIDSGYLQKVVKKLYDNGTKRGTISVGQEDYISFSPAY